MSEQVTTSVEDVATTHRYANAVVVSVPADDVEGLVQLVIDPGDPSVAGLEGPIVDHGDEKLAQVHLVRAYGPGGLTGWWRLGDADSATRWAASLEADGLVARTEVRDLD